jgi:ribosome-associated protein
MTESVLQVSDAVAIPRSELQYRASKSGGAGGQHVNTSSTRIELLWDLPGSRAIADDVRARLQSKLVKRLDANGMVRIVASARRSQLQNRMAAEERLAALVRGAMTIPKLRRKTKPSRGAKERRLSEKKHHGERKKSRSADYLE